MSWSAIRGHDGVVQSFQSAWRRGRLGHAYLFVGPNGVGKHTFAREFARALLCETPKDRLEACGHCPACVQVEAGSHPDFMQADRGEESLELKIDVIRDLVDQLALKPSRGSRKIAILDDADDLNAEAANAFLKTLEEPPPGSLLILIGGANPDRQLTTILSRCQRTAFAPLGREDLVAVLKGQGINDASRIDRLVRVAGGSPGRAIDLNDEVLWAFRSAVLADLAATRLDSDRLGRTWNEFVEQAGKDAGPRRRRASLVLQLIVGLLQDALRAAHGVTPVVADATEARTLEALGRRLGPEKLMAWIDRTLEADMHIERMVQVELAIEAFADYLGR